MEAAARITNKTCPRCKGIFASDAVFCPTDGAALEADGDTGSAANVDPYIGTVIQGDIEIRSVAGVGAMGRVYRAHQRGIDRDVAVKILHRELSGNLPLVQRFHREGKIASRLQHPHVVEVYLAGQLPDGALYIAMEFLDGMSLAAATQATGGVMTLERAIPIALQICDAVGEGHERGIVHRDLKPENVMLVRRAATGDWVKVLDFGIAKVSLGEQSMETAAGLIFGTARYISPEGAQGAVVGPPGDVYSIATMLYQLLAGRTPFDAERPVGMLIKHIHDDPPPLRSWPAAANVPEPLVRVIMDNLAKDPARRAPTARALGNAIAVAAKEANVSFSDVGVVARMSISDFGRSAPRVPLERTIDDGATLPVVVAPTRTPHGESATPAPVAVIETREVSQADASRPKPSTPPAPRRHATAIIVLAFLLGVSLTALVMQRFTPSADAEHTAHVARARRALVNGAYVEPAGENVRDLVEAGLARWPDDTVLGKIQSDATHELNTRAMAARSGGDVGGARELARIAYELEPNDPTAKLLIAQYDDELAASASDAGGSLGGPRVTLDMPLAGARLGGRIDLSARISMGSVAHPIKSAQFIVTGPGLAADGVTVPATGSGPFRATFSPPRAGEYEVQFEANVGGASVRASRSLTVTR